MLKRAISPDAALTRLEDLCSRSEQCSFEILTKLNKWGIGATEAKKILLNLRQNKYIDDSRYAHAYVRDKFLFSRWGRRKIALGLMAKRLPRQIADEALDTGLSDGELYFRHLLGIIKSKSRAMERPICFEDSQRLIRFGLSRGYETALVIKAVNHIKSMTDSEDEGSMVD